MKAIVAVDNHWGIGYQGDLLVSLPEDQKDTFKRLTLGKTVIYGRKTLYTFPGQRLLPDRTNIILSRNPFFIREGAIILHSVEDLIAYCRDHEEQELFLIGGAEIFRCLLSYCAEAIVSRIDYSFSADVFFPNLDEDPDWIEASCSDVIHSVKGFDFTVHTYRNQNVQ